MARYADEWNVVNVAPEAYAHKVEILERHCEAVGRDPSTIRRSMMAFGIVGPTGAAVDRASRAVMALFPGGRAASPEEFRHRAKDRGMIVGATEEVVERLGERAELGLREVQFQHFDFDSDDVPEYLASEYRPQSGVAVGRARR